MECLFKNRLKQTLRIRFEYNNKLYNIIKLDFDRNRQTRIFGTPGDPRATRLCRSGMTCTAGLCQNE